MKAVTTNMETLSGQLRETLRTLAYQERYKRIKLFDDDYSAPEHEASIADRKEVVQTLKTTAIVDTDRISIITPRHKEQSYLVVRPLAMYRAAPDDLYIRYTNLVQKLRICGYSAVVYTEAGIASIRVFHRQSVAWELSE